MRRWFCVMLTMLMAGCGGAVPEAPAVAPERMTFAPELGIDLAAMERLESGILVRDMRMGEGPTTRRGDNVSVRYVGWLPDGKLFDAVVPPNAPKEFRVGAGEVIRGWELGVLGMREGGQRQIVIPPALGYGRRRIEGIPPNSTLVFLVELVSVR